MIYYYFVLKLFLVVRSTSILRFCAVDLTKMSVILLIFTNIRCRPRHQRLTDTRPLLCFPEQCPPGHVSRSGLSPCYQCPPSSFQPDYGQSVCIRCPHGSTTDHSAATSVTECQGKSADRRSCPLTFGNPGTRNLFERSDKIWKWVAIIIGPFNVFSVLSALYY